MEKPDSSAEKERPAGSERADRGNSQPSIIPRISEVSGNPGEIQIRYRVVANIVRLAALEVPGVAGVVGGGFWGDLMRFFDRNSTAGIRVSIDEEGRYVIGVHLSLSFGVELARVAEAVQTNITGQVQKMTETEVSRVDVKIDGVKVPGEDRGADRKSEEIRHWHEENVS